jgi:hypothetical protein
LGFFGLVSPLLGQLDFLAFEGLSLTDNPPEGRIMASQPIQSDEEEECFSSEEDQSNAEDSEIEIDNQSPVLCRLHLLEVCSACGLDFRDLNQELRSAHSSTNASKN